MRDGAARFPNRLLIQPMAPCPRLPAEPALDGRLAHGAAALPPLWEIEGRPGFARIFVGWWPAGLYVAADVCKTGPIAVNRQRPLQNDCVVVLVNTRPDAAQRRPTRRCFQFIAQPRGGGVTRMEPVIYQEFFRQGPPQRLARGRELRVACAEREGAYFLEMAIAASALADAELAPAVTLGFECLVHDTQQGLQTWAAPEEAPVLDIPALWGLLRLAP